MCKDGRCGTVTDGEQTADRAKEVFSASLAALTVLAIEGGFEQQFASTLVPTLGLMIAGQPADVRAAVHAEIDEASDSGKAQELLGLGKKLFASRAELSPQPIL